MASLLFSATLKIIPEGAYGLTNLMKSFLKAVCVLRMMIIKILNFHRSILLKKFTKFLALGR